MKNQFVFGFVERFKPRVNEMVGGYATVIVPNLGNRQLTASDKCGPFFIGAGASSPVWDTDRRINGHPLPTDEVVMEISGVNGEARVTAWGYAKFWRKAEAEIARRPVYRVLRENRFKGQVMRGNARKEVVFTGNLQELIAESKRDGHRVSDTDKFAPTYKTGPATALNRFEVKANGSANWESCEDPRPFPSGQTYRLIYWEAGKLRQLAIGTALQIDSQFPRGANDPLKKYASAGESNGYLFWERYDRFVPEGESHWTEVNDPRPVPVAPAPKPAAPKKASSVAMPKSAKLHEFSKTLKGFDGLVLA